MSLPQTEICITEQHIFGTSDGLMKNPCLVSIIIANHNGKHFLEDCFLSLSRQIFKSFEIILVDNGSIDGSVSYVRNNFPEVTVLELGKNTGFAGGCNAGIRIASGKYILIINNDVWADPKLVGELVKTIELDGRMGMVAPKILNFHNRQEIDSVGVGIYPDGTSRGNMRLRIDDGSFDQPGEILCPSGCAALYKKEMLKDIGLFDEDFFAYCEDTDLGLRAQLAGWKGYFNPEALVYHKYSGTARPFSDRKVYFVERNRLWVLLKNFPLCLICLSPFFTLIRYFLNLLAMFTAKSSVKGYRRNYPIWKLAVTISRSYIDAFREISSIMKKREATKRKRRITARDFLKIIKRHKLGLIAII